MKSLNTQHAEYLLVGGFAVGYHGYPRSTGDLDIWIARNAVNAQKVSAALQEFGFSVSNVPGEMFLEPNSIFRIGNPPLRVELMADISGVNFADCWPIREVVGFDGIPINMIDAESLKTNKKASGRLKDLNDLKHLP